VRPPCAVLAAMYPIQGGPYDERYEYGVNDEHVGSIPSHARGSPPHRSGTGSAMGLINPLCVCVLRVSVRLCDVLLLQGSQQYFKLVSIGHWYYCICACS
jgi:hypothetical protein